MKDSNNTCTHCSKQIIFILVIDRDRNLPVCCFPWNKPIGELQNAIEDPQLYFNSRIVLALNSAFNSGNLKCVEFIIGDSFIEGKRLIDRSNSLSKFQGLVNPIGYRRHEITPPIIRAVKRESEEGYSQRDIAKIVDISAASVNNILKGRHDYLLDEQGG